MTDREMYFDEEFDRALAQVLDLSDEELLGLPDDPELERVFENFEGMNEAYLESQGYLMRSTIITEDIGSRLGNYQKQRQFRWKHDAHRHDSDASLPDHVAQTSEYESGIKGMTWPQGMSTVARFPHGIDLTFTVKLQDITVLGRSQIWREPMTAGKGEAA